MQILRKLFLFGMTVFMFSPLNDMLRYLAQVPPEQVGFGQAFFMAFAISMCATGVFAFVGFAFPTYKLLPRSYYGIKAPNRLRLMYKLLRVKEFRVLLLLFFWGWKKNRKKYFSGKKGGLDSFVLETKQSEFGHLGGLILTLGLSIPVLVNGHFVVFGIIQLFNLLGNFYPIILQRHHRMRVELLNR
ncbi:MAG: hypothetical protein JKX84_03310 [Flavobacteriales bacterium]|nr:hypothetical protein [Flavobacteriales bacterium]